jgi:hypothetical protein
VSCPSCVAAANLRLGPGFGSAGVRGVRVGGWEVLQHGSCMRPPSAPLPHGVQDMAGRGQHGFPRCTSTRGLQHGFQSPQETRNPTSRRGCRRRPGLRVASAIARNCPQMPGRPLGSHYGLCRLPLPCLRATLSATICHRPGCEAGSEAGDVGRQPGVLDYGICDFSDMGPDRGTCRGPQLPRPVATTTGQTRWQLLRSCRATPQAPAASSCATSGSPTPAVHRSSRAAASTCRVAPAACSSVPTGPARRRCCRSWRAST